MIEMNEQEQELLKAELKRLQQECEALREQLKQESEPPLHLALVVSVAEAKDRAVVMTSKRTLLEVPVRYALKDTMTLNVVVGLTRIGLSAVKIMDMSKEEFDALTKGGNQ
jgi:ATP-dependent 26S proteasome regulatory subunit